jgi:hypothetical protein
LGAARGENRVPSDGSAETKGPDPLGGPGPSCSGFPWEKWDTGLCSVTWEGI